MAERHADEIEPKFNRATVRELAVWGRLLLGVTNAGGRDNRPGVAEDALSLARTAADRIGHEVTSGTSTTRTFGPVSVAMIAAENAALTRHPNRVLAISQGIPQDVLHPGHPARCGTAWTWASVMVMLRRYPEAIDVLRTCGGTRRSGSPPRRPPAA